MSRTALFVILLFALSFSASWGAKKPVTIDDLVHRQDEVHAGDGAITWSPDGARFVVNQRGALSVYDAATGKRRDITAFDKLEAEAVKPAQSPVFDWTNRRVDESAIQWFSDGKRLLVAASGELFVVEIANGKFDQLTKTADSERDPKLSPDNKYVAFRRGPDLYVLEITAKKLIRLTHDGSDTLLNGQLDWVYPEELELGTAHWWSPDSRSIAYLQFDISHEPVFPQVSLLNPRGLLEPERYPKAGDPNAEVRLGVVPATGGRTKWMNLGEPRDFLLARVAWTPSSREIFAERLPRIQNKLDLLAASVETGAARLVLHEEDPAWINVKGEPKFLSKRDGFLWTSERHGFRHLYLYGMDGKSGRQLTDGRWEVDKVLGVDDQHDRVFFTSTEDSPMERQLYQLEVSRDGSAKGRLTQGAGTHSISLAPNCAYYLDAYSGLSVPPHSTLYKGDGTEVRVYREANRRDTDEYDILPTEIEKVNASDGAVMYARLIKPSGFQAGRKYPAVVMVYGGPGAQEIHDVWQGLSWDQVLAHKGFVIWQLDNRGSAGRGHQWESVIYHNLGARELEDQKTGINHLISMGFVDPQRIGMFGWSYGGYMTLYTLTNAPELIKAAIAGAPVTNWRNYDSIYTERYMGLPWDNEEGYKVSSPMSKAANLRSKLLIIHNIEDDNVHFQNTVQMTEALEKANKQFYMLVYPQKSHGVTGPVRKHLLEETTAFFEENLK